MIDSRDVFVVFDVADIVVLEDRPGILAQGELKAGVVRAGAWLNVERTQAKLRVIGIEFPTPSTPPDRLTLIIDGLPSEVVPGDRLLG